MTIQWADFPSGQQGLYGTDTSLMLDGTPWLAANPGGTSGGAKADPDTTNFPNGVAFRHSSGSSGPQGAARLALTDPHNKVGLAARLYIDAFDGNERAIYTFNNVGNGVMYYLTLLPNGGMRLLNGIDEEQAAVTTPLIFAASWNHLEFVIDDDTGDYELRKNGVPVPGMTGTLALPSGGEFGIVGFPNRVAGSAQGVVGIYSKDIVIYNGAGTQFNDFQGTVAVYDTVPDADVTQGDWTLSSGTDAYALLDESPPNDAGYVQSGLPVTAPLEVGLTDLPVDITSVRAIFMMMRGFNSDSGDGWVQMSVSPDGGVNTDTGLEHPMTVSATFYYDASELSPATGAAWTPTEINNLTITFNRTV